MLMWIPLLKDSRLGERAIDWDWLKSVIFCYDDPKWSFYLHTIFMLLAQTCGTGTVYYSGAY